MDIFRHSDSEKSVKDEDETVLVVAKRRDPFLEICKGEREETAATAGTASHGEHTCTLAEARLLRPNFSRAGDIFEHGGCCRGRCGHGFNVRRNVIRVNVYCGISSIPRSISDSRSSCCDSSFLGGSHFSCMCKSDSSFILPFHRCKT